MARSIKRALLIFVVTLVVLIGIVVILLRNGESKPTPATPDAVQFRRVVTAELRACTKGPLTANERCSTDGTRYTLGAVEVDGSHVTKVKAVEGSQGWYVALTMDDAGAAAFGRMMADLAASGPPKNQFAIVVRDKVVTAPVVQKPLTGHEFRINGNYTSKAAQQLVADITG